MDIGIQTLKTRAALDCADHRWHISTEIVDFCASHNETDSTKYEAN